MLHFSDGASPRAVADACGGKLLNEGKYPIRGAAIDSRAVKPGDLFVAVPGERTDGHRFLVAAAEAGAAAVLIRERTADLPELTVRGLSVILCRDTVASLGRLAAAHKAECGALTVAVTGSVGKTTTRQYIASVLSQRFSTHKTEGNYNNELGVPLTLLSLRPSQEAAVLELGMSARGEISYLTGLVRPDLAVITVIGTAHIEFLGSREAIRDAKMEIAEGLRPGGRLILNGDEPLLAGVPGACYVSLQNPKADFQAVELAGTEDGMRFTLRCPGFEIRDCRIPTLGTHTVLDASYAAAIGVLAGLSPDEIRAGLASFEGVGMRQRICRRGGITYILDYYNASPESIRASLTVACSLAAENGGRTVAVLGSVLELGENAERLHREIGRFVAASGVGRLFTFGKEAAYIADEAVKAGMPPETVSVFTDTDDAGSVTDAVRQALRPGDAVLLKASHSLRLERIAEPLLADEATSEIQKGTGTSAPPKPL